jgi:hypothetical protein
VGGRSWLFACHTELLLYTSPREDQPVGLDADHEQDQFFQWNGPVRHACERAHVLFHEQLCASSERLEIRWKRYACVVLSVE